jgi:hypothetical protein
MPATTSDRCAEVSIRHSRRKETGIDFGSMDELGTRPAIERVGNGNSRPNRKELDVMPPLKARTVPLREGLKDRIAGRKTREY